MGFSRMSYAQLLETNNLIQACADETYWLCVTRTVQELEAVSGSRVHDAVLHDVLSIAILRFYAKSSRACRPRRSATGRATPASRSKILRWAGRCPASTSRSRVAINLGLIRPQDAVEDLAYVMDFWKRFQLSWHRNNGHITNKDLDTAASFLPERRLQVFHADMFDCKAGDELARSGSGFHGGGLAIRLSHFLREPDKSA